MEEDQIFIKDIPELLEEAAIGAGFYLRQVSLPIFDLESKEVSSGTLVSLGDHIFVATAGHVIPRNPNGKLWLINKDGRHECDGFPSFLRWNCHYTANIDVGYLEIDPATAKEYFGHNTYCNVENIANFGVGRARRFVAVVGTPKDKVQVEGWDGNTCMIKFEGMPYWTIPLMPPAWPKVAATDPVPNEEVDVFLGYPEDGIRVLETGEPILLPAPNGMSGGGVWDLGFSSSQAIWDPTQCKLFAIQGSWNPQLRYLRGTQVSFWTDLIVTDYPDLYQLLETSDLIYFFCPGDRPPTNAYPLKTIDNIDFGK